MREDEEGTRREEEAYRKRGAKGNLPGALHFHFTTSYTRHTTLFSLRRVRLKIPGTTDYKIYKATTHALRKASLQPSAFRDCRCESSSVSPDRSSMRL